MYTSIYNKRGAFLGAFFFGGQNMKKGRAALSGMVGDLAMGFALAEGRVNF